MTLACPVHAHNAPPGKPRSRFYAIAHRIARRMEPQIAAAFIDAVTKLQEQIDEAVLASALASGGLPGSLPTIEAAARAGDLGYIMANDPRVAEALFRTTTITGKAGADVLEDVTGMEFRFNARHPNVVLYAREQTAVLVRRVGDDVREAIRIIISAGADYGLTTAQQARAIREVVGLPSNWARAPLNLADELNAGRFTESRRLSAVDKARIRKRIKDGTIDQAFVSEMQTKYTKSLINRRAKNIARTESLRAAHHGQQEAWLQAKRQGVLPSTTRRVWIVTPDDRLRFTHAQIPGMNDGGVPLEAPFQTPLGTFMNPPIEPNCIVPGTQMQGRFVAALRAQYAGEVVVVQTASGRNLTVTPNHQILTPDGFVAAGSVRDGDYLICHTGDVQRNRLPGPDEHEAPAAIEHVFSALSQCGPGLRSHCAIEHLHGDARYVKGDVEVVGAQRKLLVNRLAPVSNGGSDVVLEVAAAQPALVSGARTSNLYGDGIDLTPTRSMGRFDLSVRGAGDALELAPFQALSFGLAAHLHPRVFKALRYGAAVMPGSIADRLYRLAREVGGDDCRDIDIQPIAAGASLMAFGPRGQTVLDSPRANGGGADSELARNLLQRHVGEVECDKVVSVDRRAWHGHVYDLESVSGWNIANGIITSNCRCGTGLIFPGLEGVL